MNSPDKWILQTKNEKNSASAQCIMGLRAKANRFSLLVIVN